MQWCGFDESMRTGLVVFARGVSAAIADKAAKLGLSFSDQIERERYELAVLEDLIEKTLAIEDSHLVRDRARLKAFLGMVSVARFLIEQPRANDPHLDETLNFGRRAFALGSLIETFDIEYERQPVEQAHEVKAFAALLATFGLDTELLIQDGDTIAGVRRVHNSAYIKAKHPNAPETADLAPRLE